MTTQEIEAWASRVITIAKNRQHNEDSKVELKAIWPIDPNDIARRIAGHVNALLGEPVLWLIGVNEKNGVSGIPMIDFATWWNAVAAQFESYYPTAKEVVIKDDDKSAMAILITPDRIPYVVKNKQYGEPKVTVQYEVPWREGTAIKSARHNDLVQMLDTLNRPKLCIGVGETPKHKSYVTVHTPKQNSNANCQYVRAKITNVGRHIAKNCIVLLEDITHMPFKPLKGTKPTGVLYHDDLPLTWSYRPEIAGHDLLPNAPYWVDLISTNSHSDSFWIESNPKITKYAPGLNHKGYYKLSLRAYAEGAEVQADMHFEWDGKWDSVKVISLEAWEAVRRTTE